MIVDYTIEQKGDYIIVTDLTYKPKIKKLNIQIVTPSGKIINTTYAFRKINIYGESVLGLLEYGNYAFKVHNIEKLFLCSSNFPLKRMYPPNKFSKYFKELEVKLKEQNILWK